MIINLHDAVCAIINNNVSAPEITFNYNTASIGDGKHSAQEGVYIVSDNATQAGVHIISDNEAQMGVYFVNDTLAKVGGYSLNNDIFIDESIIVDIIHYDNHVYINASNIVALYIFIYAFTKVVTFQVCDFLRYPSIQYYNYYIHVNIDYTIKLYTCPRLYLHSFYKYSISIASTFKRLMYEDNQIVGSCVGGGRIPTFTYAELHTHVSAVHEPKYDTTTLFKYFDHIHKNEAHSITDNNNTVIGQVPLEYFVPNLLHKDIKRITQMHGIKLHKKIDRNKITELLKDHHCSICVSHTTVFIKHIVKSNAEICMKWYYKNKSTRKNKTQIKENFKKNIKPWETEERIRRIGEFPPAPHSPKIDEAVIAGCCEDLNSYNFIESGCAVCGQIVSFNELNKLSETECDLSILKREGYGVTRLERHSTLDPIQEIKGPVLDNTCRHICIGCENSLFTGITPKYALAKGFWLGNIPEQLQDLTFAEKLLIARVRHNRCIVKVSSGMHKIKCNAIMFDNPTPKIYQSLPPPIEDLDDVLAFIFTGPCRPTDEDLERTPLLVRRRKVAAALEWLKLNHVDYYDLDISYNNLSKYPKNGTPVVVAYRQMEGNKEPETISAFDNETEEGVEIANKGPCPFVVNGITGERLTTYNTRAVIAKAIKHIKKDKGGVLAISHGENPQSIFHNPQLYPMMFPHLFPYGLGGISSIDSKFLKVSDAMHKRRLLMYHDKRFQTDAYFPLVAFNHEQIKRTVTAAHLMTDRHNFNDIVHRLLKVDTTVLSELSDKLSKGERAKPETDAEKACYQLISDLDYVSGHVQGSMTSKKRMKNEIWSMISYLGAPSWFITFAPADIKNPICLYFADKKEVFSPKIRAKDESYRLIAHNPVAGARFFDFIVRLFLKHVLGIDADHDGLFGKVSGYYGTVEQQGRLTLHLHLLLWILASLTPQEIRDKIMDENSDFQKRMVQYLESLCVGDFLTGTKEQVSLNVREASKDVNYKNPTHTLPDPPKTACSKSCGICVKCRNNKTWWKEYKSCVDDILIRSNIHSHKVDRHGNDVSYCRDSNGECKRRFPRTTYEQTLVDTNTGALNLKKGEPWMNTFTPTLTYILRCNSDVTSLLSGTAVKAVVAYVTDYITKQPLKTYSVFDVIKSVFDRNTELLSDKNIKREEKVRKLYTQMVNSLTVKSELGGPMASLYILGNPDHYKSHIPVPFQWRGYVREVLNAWDDNEDIKRNVDNCKEKLIIQKEDMSLIGVSKIFDYIYRPSMYERVCLYDWIRFSSKTRKRKLKKSKKTKNNLKSENENNYDNMDDISEDDSVNYMTDEEADKDNNSDNEENNGKVDHWFQSEHPQYKSHKIRMKKYDDRVFPCFLPDHLPRPDYGDREYYCCTMLTLFKPWRSGRNLKEESESWHNAFTTFKFTDSQREKIEFFGIRYQCLDARDDYAANRRTNKSGINYQWATSDMLDSLDDTHETERVLNGADFNTQLDYITETTFDIPSMRDLHRQHAMECAERTMRNSGWLDACEDGLLDVGLLKPINPTIEQTKTSWKSAINDEKQRILQERNQNLPKDTIYKTHINKFKPNEVKVISGEYLAKTFTQNSKEDRKFIKINIEKYNLNKEQKRAFKIVANHATSKNPEPLHMYLGGMAGTGKSQVIKALIDFFHVRNESHRLLIVAPTGSAAALLKGSTYHSVFCINDNYSNAESLARLRANLDSVDYVFLDEASMLSCIGLYKISAQCAKAREEYGEPFGGINFIFAGDFAQLPPIPPSYSLYSGTVGARLNSSHEIKKQEASIGKALWHQVTTVVILRENMRQKTQTVEDSQLRTALENMRYRACTDQDIQFLNTRIAGKRPNDPKLAQKRFRNISVITAFNSQKDKFNDLGCERFANENNQKLVTFYSIDRWRQPNESERQLRNVRILRDPRKVLKYPLLNNNVFSSALQKTLWNQPPSSTNQHIPGKLKLCIGMPVMLRSNDATECCITKGAEATIVNWQSYTGPEGQNTLETLFVKLTNPPRTIKIDGLPENVVPIISRSITIQMTLPNDEMVTLSRQQVSVLPNFAMTDFASQGKTRPDNVVDLSNCRDHQSYYTCLSRSASAAGTIIIQGFDKTKIQGGISGYLRQEFRELEILDEITYLKHINKCPEHISGTSRHTLIKQFLAWKGTSYVPKNVHSTIKWDKSNPFRIVDADYSPWQIIRQPSRKKSSTSHMNTHNTEHFIPAKGSVPNKKRKIPIENINLPELKKVKYTHDTFKEKQPIVGNKKRKLINDDSSRPKKISRHEKINNILKGFIWDADNYSCAYDALFTILHSIWNQDPLRWKPRFEFINNTMRYLASGFEQEANQKITLEYMRDNIRHILHEMRPEMFPYNHNGTDIHDLANVIFQTDAIVSSSYYQCIRCEYIIDPKTDLRSSLLYYSSNTFMGTTAEYLLHVLSKDNQHMCIRCGNALKKITKFISKPTLIVFAIYNTNLNISKHIQLGRTLYNLKGIVYLGDFHFIAQIITPDNMVWLHDGIETKEQCQYVGNLDHYSELDLLTCNGKEARLVVYSLTDE
jgi:Helitron helicase-like domain at N-terminus/PIF1-like helicase